MIPNYSQKRQGADLVLYVGIFTLALVLGLLASGWAFMIFIGILNSAFHFGTLGFLPSVGAVLMMRLFWPTANSIRTTRKD